MIYRKHFTIWSTSEQIFKCLFKMKRRYNLHENAPDTCERKPRSLVFEKLLCGLAALPTQEKKLSCHFQVQYPARAREEMTQNRTNEHTCMLVIHCYNTMQKS